MAKAMDAILLDDDESKLRKNKRKNKSGQPSTSASDGEPQSTDDGDGPVQTKSKKKLGCFATVFILVFLGILATCVAYFVCRSQSQGRFETRLSELAEAGTPVLLEDAELLYQIPNRSLDATDDWVAVMKTIGSRKFQDTIANVDLLEWQQHPTWPPQRWNGIDTTERILSDQQTLVTNLQLATMEFARFKFDLFDRPVVNSRRLTSLSEGYDLLERACHLAAHRGQRDRLADLLTCCLGYYRCLQLHPEHQTEQLILRRRGLMTLLSALETLEFRPEDLNRFRKQVATFDPWQPANRYWNLHRTLLVSFYNEPDEFKKTAYAKLLASDSAWEDFEAYCRQHRGLSPFPGHDGLKFLEYMDQVQATFEGNPLKKVSEIVQLQQQISNDEPTGLDVYRHPTAYEMVPKVDQLVQLSGEVAAIQQVALGALAFDYKRIESNEKVLIRDLAKAAEAFLASEPIDLYTDFPLTVKLNNNELLILSTGPNKANDNLTGDDIGIRLPLDKWDFKEDPAVEVD